MVSESGVCTETDAEDEVGVEGMAPVQDEEEMGLKVEVVELIDGLECPADEAPFGIAPIWDDEAGDKRGLRGE